MKIKQLLKATLPPCSCIVLFCLLPSLPITLNVNGNDEPNVLSKFINTTFNWYGIGFLLYLAAAMRVIPFVRPYLPTSIAFVLLNPLFILGLYVSFLGGLASLSMDVALGVILLIAIENFNLKRMSSSELIRCCSLLMCIYCITGLYDKVRFACIDKQINLYVDTAQKYYREHNCYPIRITSSFLYSLVSFVWLCAC